MKKQRLLQFVFVLILATAKAVGQAQFSDLAVTPLAGQLQAWELVAPTEIGASSFSINRSSTFLAPGRGMLVVGAWSTTAELRLINSVSGAAVTPNAVLARAHSAGEAVVWLPFGLVDWTLWGARNTGSSADATTNATAFNRLTQEIYNIGTTKGPAGIHVPNGIYYVDSELCLERDQELAGNNVNSSVIRAASGFPFTTTGEVAIIHPFRDGNPVIYETPGPSGRWPISQLQVDGALLANSNGILSSPQQPDHWDHVRVLNCLGLYGVCLADVQQHCIKNLELGACRIALRLRSVEFLTIDVLNIEGSGVGDLIAETQPGGAGCNSNHLLNIHLESPLTTGQVYFDIRSGDQWIIENLWCSNPQLAATLLKFDVTDSAIAEYPMFDVRSIRANGNDASFLMVHDVQRGKTLNSSDEHRTIAQLVSGTDPEWAFHISGSGPVKIRGTAIAP